jgi:hypothetical protein
VSNGYLIGESLLSRIRSTVDRVDGQAIRVGDASIPTSLQSLPQVAFRVCTYTGAWSINTSNTVTFKNQTTTPNTVSAVNLFLTLPDNGERNCAIAKDGNEWHLIQWQWDASTAVSSATLGTASLVFSRINVPSLGTASTVAISVTTCSTAAS